LIDGLTAYGQHVFPIIYPEEVPYPPEHLEGIALELEGVREGVRRGDVARLVAAGRGEGQLLHVVEVLHGQVRGRSGVVATHLKRRMMMMRTGTLAYTGKHKTMEHTDTLIV
jgi:hypothetical protein